MLSVAKTDRYAVFIDGANFHASTRALGFEVDYEKLMHIFKAEGRLIRVYYYTALPDGTEFAPIRRLSDWLDYNGYTMVTKQTREFVDEDTGRRRVKGNMDMELALDMLKLAPHIDHAVLFSGDGDFNRLLQEIQGKGIRVSVVSTLRTRPPLMADIIRRQADEFVELDDLRDVISRPPRPFTPHDDSTYYSDEEELRVLEDRRKH